MARIPIAVQLYSVRGECERDLPRTLAAIAKMGYEGVEFAGYYGRSAADLRKTLEDVGLRVAGTHIGLPALQGEELPRTIEFNQGLGNENLVVAWMAPEKLRTQADQLDFARALDEAAEKVKPHGMRTGYHNHAHEFQGADGETAWDVLARNTSSSVIMQLDLGNAMHGGADPIAFLEMYADRAWTIHLKEHSGSNPNALLGEGDVPWREVFRLCQAAGKTEWYIIEQEVYPTSPLDTVARCLKNLQELLR